ncbi:MAG: hypothetical protein II664_01785, partial [Oscillospiraceae bacterium]|nr:hypothetical protein [Oscillospiraceae bacterium]
TRSMLATAIFHLFLNVMQEKINIAPETKCIETVVMLAAAAVVIVFNKELFFGKEHIGRLLEVQAETDERSKK